jgi:hypothetical protein
MEAGVVPKKSETISLNIEKNVFKGKRYVLNLIALVTIQEFSILVTKAPNQEQALRDQKVGEHKISAFWKFQLDQLNRLFSHLTQQRKIFREQLVHY